MPLIAEHPAAASVLILTRFPRSRDNTCELTRTGSTPMSTNASSLASEPHTSATWRIVFGYALMLLIAVGLLWLILSYGSKHLSPAAAEAARSAAACRGAAPARCRCTTCCLRWC